MHPNITKMYKDRYEEFLIALKSDIYSDSIPLNAKIAVTDEPVKFSDRLALDYKPVKKGEIWGHEWQSAWFNFNVEVPEKFAGQELCLRIHINGETLIFDRDGNPVYSLTGWSIFDAAYCRDRYVIGKKDAGTKLDYWVEGTANGLLGIIMPNSHELQPVKKHGSFSPVISHMDLCVFNREVWELMIDVTVMASLMEASGFEKRSGMRMLYELNKVVDIYNFNPANAKAARQYLAEKVFSKTAASTAMTVTCVGHSHIDIGWLWPVRESIRKAARTFSTQLAVMDKYPDYIFGASQAELYMMIKENYPALYERIREKIKEGRWEIQGGMWVEPDCNIISGESMVRQFLYGKNFFMDEFGYDVRNLWIPDAFGYSGSMPQIIKKSGCDCLLTQKISWSKVNKFPHNTFRWRGIDGTEILTHFPPEDTYNAECTPLQRIKAENNFKENAFIDEFISLFGIGDGGGGPSEEYLARNERMKDWDGCPKARYGTAAEYFKRLSKYTDELPYWDGELYLELHRGVLTTQSKTKKGNRYCEQALAALEFFASCNDLKDYPSEFIAGAYRDLLRNQFHDILPGSSIRLVYDRTEKEYADTLTDCKNEMDKVAAKLFEISNDCCTIVNTLSVPWSGILELPESWHGFDVKGADGANGKSIRITVPAFSFTVIKKGGKKTFECKPLSETVLENDFVRYEFNRNGEILSAYDKTCNRELISGRGNIVSFYHDLPKVWDAWEVEIHYRRNKLDNVSVEFAGGYTDEVASELNFVFKTEKSVISQKIVLRPDSARLDFVTHADWHESHVLLQTEFQTAIQGRAFFDIQYGQLERAAHDNTSWEEAKYEVCGQRYADLSCRDYGMALLNDCKYGYRVKDGTLSLSLLRAAKYPDFEADMGEHDFVYSIFPHSGDVADSKVYEEAAILNRKPYLSENFAAPENYDIPCRIISDGVSLEIIKKAEKSNDRIIRLVEFKGRISEAELHFAKYISNASYTNLIEWENGDPIKLDNNTAKITLKPYEIVTIRLT